MCDSSREPHQPLYVHHTNNNLSCRRRPLQITAISVSKEPTSERWSGQTARASGRVRHAARPTCFPPRMSHQTDGPSPGSFGCGRAVFAPCDSQRGFVDKIDFAKPRNIDVRKGRHRLRWPSHYLSDAAGRLWTRSACLKRSRANARATSSVTVSIIEEKMWTPLD